MKKILSKKILAAVLAMSMLLTGCGASSFTSDSKAESMVTSPSAPSMMQGNPETGGNGNSNAIFDSAVTEDALMKEEIIEEELGAPNIPVETPMENTTTTSTEVEKDPLSGKNIKLIWRANIELETLDFDTMLEGLNQSISEFGGYIESSYTEGGDRLNGGKRTRYGDFTVRIPAKNLDDFLNQMGTIGNVISKSKNSENITLEYADQEARKATLLLEEKKLMELLEQATELSDIIALESRLSEVHFQLDAYSSTLRKYDDLVDYSTIYVMIREVQQMTETKAETIGERISSKFSDSLYDLKVFAGDSVVFLIGRSPIIIIWAVVIGLAVLVIRKIKLKNIKLSQKFPVPKYKKDNSSDEQDKK